MTDFWKNVTDRWQDSLAVLLGVWLFFSAWILGFTEITAAFWNALIFGAAMTLIALMALVQRRLWEEWVDAAIGVWLVISPWVLGFAVFGGETAAVSAAWNAVIVGALAAILAIWSLRDNWQGGAHA